MNIEATKIIRVIVKEDSSRYAVSQPIYKEDYGLYLLIEGLELPEIYTVDFSASETASSSISMLGNSDGVLIPQQFIKTGQNIFAFLYLTGNEFGRTVYKFKIPNRIRPDRTNEEPEPEEQSIIDQAITALNNAVEQTAEAVQTTSINAERAFNSAESAEQARDDAYDYANNAQSSAESASESARVATEKATASAESASEAEQAKDTAETYMTAAQDYAEQADASATVSVNSAEQAESARDTAQGYATQAQTSANSAQTSASQANASASASAQSASASAQIKSDIEGMVDDAQGYANSASQSASQASASEQGCARAVSDATSAAAIARARADEASGYAQTASTKASEAVGCVEIATQKATESAQSASQALSYKTDAESAKTASQTAQGLAESARDTAVSAKTDAESARDDAQTAQGLAESARDSAIQAKNDAESAKADAESARDEAQQAVASISGALADKAPIITDTASGAIASFTDGADNLPLKSLVVDINPIQDLSQGDPSPENICPISGWTQVNVNHSDADMTNPTTITINLGQTVYGGHLDVLSGKLVVTHKAVDMGTLSWSMQIGSGTQLPRFYTTGISSDVSREQTQAAYVVMLDLKAPILVPHSNPVYSRVIDNAMCVVCSTGGFYATCSMYSSAEDFKTAVSGMMLVYRLAEPIEIQLSSNQINSLLGVNNIWADSGDTTAEYRADTKLFIERLTAPDSADMIADANITSGQYFMVGNNLFKATANIANGSAIVIGTNCIRKSLSEALNEINA